MSRAKRELTEKQHRSLDRITTRDPRAKVVGWENMRNFGGPVILLSDGTYKSVSGTGYPKQTDWSQVEADFDKLVFNS